MTLVIAWDTLKGQIYLQAVQLIPNKLNLLLTFKLFDCTRCYVQRVNSGHIFKFFK